MKMETSTFSSWILAIVSLLFSQALWLTLLGHIWYWIKWKTFCNGLVRLLAYGNQPFLGDNWGNKTCEFFGLTEQGSFEANLANIWKYWPAFSGMMSPSIVGISVGGKLCSLGISMEEQLLKHPTCLTPDIFWQFYHLSRRPKSQRLGRQKFGLFFGGRVFAPGTSFRVDGRILWWAKAPFFGEVFLESTQKMSQRIFLAVTWKAYQICGGALKKDLKCLISWNDISLHGPSSWRIWAGKS